MSEFYKLSIADWNVGTDMLSLEQEAAYLRVVNAINLYDQPIRDNLRVLGGLWRCNERKAARLRQELIDAGKLTIEDGLIFNERAVDDVSKRRQLRVERKSSGSRGGVESGKSRRKPLTKKECGEATASTRIEENRIEEKIPPKPPKGGGDAGVFFEEWWKHYPRKVAKGAARRAFAKALKKTDLETLTTTVQRFAAKIAGKDPELIPHAATWLNAERWGDEDLAPTASGADLAKRAEAKVAIARDWLTRNDTIPTWMDDAETAKTLLEEGHDYDRLRKAGFRLPPRGKVVNIGDEIERLARSKAVGEH